VKSGVSGGLDVAEAIALVHAAGGKTFLAHPHMLGSGREQFREILTELQTLGLDGVEVYYRAYTPAQQQILAGLAEELGLLASGGSDAHERRGAGTNDFGVNMPTAAWKRFRDAVSANGSSTPPAQRAAAPAGRLVQWRHFFFHFVFPTVLALALFAIAMFGVFLPAFQRSLLERKREMIRELTNSAWSILAEYERDERAGKLTRAQAQDLARERIEYLRYGREGKDYFWLQDLRPRIIMHPYRKDLNGQDVSDFRDQRGVPIFVEFADLVRRQGEGYLEYYWQWKDDPSRVVPKESYIRGFQPWGWIIGTGMYLEDVQAEIGRLLARLTWIFVAIVATLALLLLYVVRQSMKIEQERSRGEEALRASHEKYRALVEVATEGTMMVVDGRCTYANPTMLEMLGYDAEEFLLLDLEDLLPEDGNALAAPPLAALRAGGPIPANFEVRLRTKQGESLEVMAAATRITVAGQEGFILVAKDLSRQERIEAELLGGPHSYRPLAEQIGLGIFRVGLGRRKLLSRANAAARRLFGLADGAELSAVDFLELFLDPRDRADVLHAMETQGTVTDRVIRLRDGKGQGPIASLSLVVVRDKAGTATYWDGVIQDVTRQRRLELQRDTLIAELQTSLLFLNDSIKQAQYAPPRVSLATPIGTAADQMTRQDSSALFVTAESGEVIGLVTDRDFRERVAARRLDPARPVVEIMSAPLVAIPDTALVYEAILLMQVQGKRHLAVRDASGRVSGLVTNIALLHFDRYSSIVMTREIARAAAVDDLAAIYERLPRLVGALIDSGAKPRNVTRVITAAQDAVVRRLIALAETALGPPPGPFTFVALGSEGREEKTLVSDQDNAIVYADPDPEQAARTAAYFLALGGSVCDGLAKIGIPYCKGGIMAKTEEWCQPLSRWKEHFSRWIETAKPQDFLEINMFFDFRSVHGDPGLLFELRQHINRRLRATPPFFVNYAQNALLYKPPLGYFGALVSEAIGTQPRAFDLKDALRPIVGFARLYALQHGLTATNTLDRLQQLLEREAVRRSVCEEAVAAYHLLMELRLARQAAALRGSEPPGNDVDLRALTAIQASMLKQALLQVASIQRQIQQDFVGTAPSL